MIYNRYKMINNFENNIIYNKSKNNYTNLYKRIFKITKTMLLKM